MCNQTLSPLQELNIGASKYTGEANGLYGPVGSRVTTQLDKLRGKRDVLLQRLKKRGSLRRRILNGEDRNDKKVQQWILTSFSEVESELDRVDREIKKIEERIRSYDSASIGKRNLIRRRISNRKIHFLEN